MIAALFAVLTAQLAGLGSAPSVEIAVIGTPSDLQRVRELVDPSRLGGASPRWTRAERFDPTEVLRPGSSLRCWVDLSHPQRSRVRVTFADRSGERFLVRDVDLSGRFDELDRQSLAQVLELSVTALLEDERVGVTRVEAQALLLAPLKPPQAPVPPVPPPAPQAKDHSSPRPLGRLHLGAFYAAKVLGDRFPVVHGPGLSMEWAAPRRLVLWSAWIEGQAQLPSQVETSTIGLRFFTLATRAGLGLGWAPARQGDPASRGSALELQRLIARVGVGVDFVRLSPQSGSADQSAVPAPTRWSESWVISASVGLVVSAGPVSWLELRLFADVLPTTVHYDVARAGEIRSEFAPWRVRPGVAIAVTL